MQESLGLDCVSDLPGWRHDLDRSIWAWRAKDLDAGAHAVRRLLEDPETPDRVRSVGRANATWYAPLLAEWLPAVRFSSLVPVVREGWTTFNPSIISSASSGLVATVRSSNYSLGDNGSYVISDPDGVVRSETYLVELNERVEILRSKMIEPATPRRTTDFPVQGYEDVRLFEVDGRLCALATVRDLSPGGLCQMVLLHIGRSGLVQREFVLDGPVPERHEKNWAPFAVAGGRKKGRSVGQISIVYGWDPLTIFELDVRGGTLGELRSTGVSGLGPDTRGGTPGVTVPGGTLFVVHEQVWMNEGDRRYPHRFVLVDDQGAVRGVSPRFFFFTRAVEFAVGLARVDERLLVSFGVADEHAWIADCALGDVLQRLCEPGRAETDHVRSPSMSGAEIQ